MNRARAAVLGRPMWSSALAGLLLALALAPIAAWYAAPLALALVGALFAGAASARLAALLGFVCGTAYFAVALIWIVEPFLVDVARHGWMAPFALVFLAGGLALFWAAAFWAAHRIGPHPVWRVIALVCAWSLAEFGRATVFTGLPWAALAQIWPGTPVALLLAWVGPQGLAVLTLAAFLPLFLVGRSWAAVIPAVIFGGAVGLAVVVAPTPGQGDKVVRLIQPNAQQDKKWHPDHMWGFFRRQLEMTAERSGARAPDLIVWPETAIPSFLHQAEVELAAIARAAQGVPVVLGLRRRTERRLFNAMIYLDETGHVAQVYDKHHLVPFGEYVPFGDLAARFGISGFAAERGEGFSPGPGPATLSFGDIGRAVPLICYEAVFPDDVNGAPERGDFLVQITNDAWFGTRSGPYQHLAQARMRAIEQGLPMIRVANTGISAMIDPQGRIIGSLPLNTEGYLDVILPPPLARTLYARTGDAPVFWLLVVLAGVLVALQIRHRTAKGH